MTLLQTNTEARRKDLPTMAINLIRTAMDEWPPGMDCKPITYGVTSKFQSTRDTQERTQKVLLNISRLFFASIGSVTRTIIYVFILFVISAHIGFSQDFVNRGQIKNSGTIRIKNNAVGFPSTVSGTFEMFGSDQTLPRRQYSNVLLTGNGTKIADSSFSILKNLTIASAVTLNITKGSVITLGDTLFEQGTLKGAIQKSVDLSSPVDSSSFGNLGAKISWSGSAPGITTVLRASDSLSIGNGNQSVKRYYEITPTISDATGTLTLSFSEEDVAGQDIHTMHMWRSMDNGATWKWQSNVVVDTLLRSVSKMNSYLAGRWTISDSLHALGPIGNPGEPASMMLTSTNNPSAPITMQVTPFTVIVLDAFDAPVKNDTVRFAIDSIPALATGTLLSDSLVITDSTGKATTHLTLGTKVGVYVVSAQIADLPKVKFTATALHGPAAEMSLVAGNLQSQKILTTLDSLFRVSVVDIGGNIVDSATVQFTIITSPPNASGQNISTLTALTDSMGRAETQLTLGDKVGTYTVRASVSGVQNPITFTAQAVPGDPATIALSSGNNQSAVNNTTLLQPFTVNVQDIGKNNVPGDTVRFIVLNRPLNTVGDSLSDTVVVSDTSGLAQSTLRLGQIAGAYEVIAVSKSLTDTVRFAATALAGAPDKILAESGDQQSAPILTALTNDVVVSIADISGNPVPSASVTFSVSSTPQGATGFALSSSDTLTDTLGRARTRLTLGNKVGVYEVTAFVPTNRPDDVVRINGKKFKAAVNTVTGKAEVKFTATAVPGAPAEMMAALGLNQEKEILTPLDLPFTVHVIDVGGNSVPNATVDFGITSRPLNATGDQLSTAATTTNESGEAFTLLTLGNKVGTYEVTASITTPSNSEAVVINGKKFKSSKNNSTLSVIEVKFTANALPGAAAAIAVNSGDEQTGPIVSQLALPLVVRVLDIGANFVPNSMVNFSIVSTPANASGTTLSSAIVQTDTGGLAATSLTLGDKVGDYTISASVNGILTATFTATATPGSPTVMNSVTGTDQSDKILTTLSTPFTVNVIDLGGNPVPGVIVRYTLDSIPLNANGTMLSDTTYATDSTGTSRTSLTLGSKVGKYYVTAEITTPNTNEAIVIRSPKAKIANRTSKSSTAVTVSFVATAQPGLPALVEQVMGNHLTRPTGVKLDTAFTVTVRDVGSNAVPGVPVSFAIASAPTFATGQMLTDTLVSTDSLGQASTTLTLGTYDGTYDVTATAPGVASVTFSTSAFLIYGDPNADIEVNIADITTLVDHITGAKKLNGVDSVKADLNRDGRVDTLDINVIRDQILRTSITSKTIMPFTEPAATIPQIAALKKQVEAATSFATFEATNLGLRLNLENTEPVRGIELRIQLKDSTLDVRAINMLFTRAREMRTIVVTDGNEIRLVAYNQTNTEIAPGNGPVLRIPKITALSMIDTTQVILSLHGNSAVRPAVAEETASPTQYPATFVLYQNYPNPFNGETTIEYEIPDKEGAVPKVLIQIYNVLGQHVKTLKTGEHDPGRYSIRWNGTDEYGSMVASGVYFYRMLAKNHISSRKMLYVK